jgi:hypothetical protein
MQVTALRITSAPKKMKASRRMMVMEGDADARVVLDSPSYAVGGTALRGMQLQSLILYEVEERETQRASETKARLKEKTRLAALTPQESPAVSNMLHVPSPSNAVAGSSPKSAGVPGHGHGYGMNVPCKPLYRCTVVHACQALPGTSYRALPFFDLQKGIVLDVLREEGHPNSHKDLSLHVSSCMHNVCNARELII